MITKHIISILLCLNFAFFFSACDKAEIQKSVAKIESRSDCVDECDDCPVDDCCCAITLTDGFTTNLIFCGVTDPCLSTQACSVEAGSCVISGYELYSALSSVSNPTELFCVNKNSAFYILSSANVSARITCQLGQANPQYVNVTFNTPNNKAYYVVDGDCTISNCL